MRLSGFSELVILDSTLRGAGFTCSPSSDIMGLKRVLSHMKKPISRVVCEISYEMSPFDVEGKDDLICLYFRVPRDTTIFFEIIYKRREVCQ